MAETTKTVTDALAYLEDARRYLSNLQHRAGVTPPDVDAAMGAVTMATRSLTT